MRLPQYRGPGGAGNFSGALAATRRRLLRFLFNPPPLGSFPRQPAGFAARLARGPVDLITRLGMVRSNACFDAGCPVELCDHAAARDLWAVIYQDILESASSATSASKSGPPNTASLTHRSLPRKS